MRKLAALLVVACLLASAAVALAQDTTGNPPQGQPDPQIIAPEIYQRATTAIDDARYDDAVVDLSLTLLLNPTYPRAYFARAIAYENLKQMTQALDDLAKAIPLAKTAPDLQASMYGLRAQIYTQDQKFPEAIDDLNAAIKISPDPQLIVNRGQLYLFDGKYDSAIADFNTAIQLVPDQKVVLFYRASAYEAQGKDVDAAADYLGWLISLGAQTASGDAVDLGTTVQLDMADMKIYIVPFKATRGQVITAIASKTSGDVDPLMVLLDPNRKPLTANDDARPGDTTSVIAGYRIPNDGDYLLIVYHAMGGSDGRVALQIEGQ